MSVICLSYEDFNENKRTACPKMCTTMSTMENKSCKTSSNGLAGFRFDTDNVDYGLLECGVCKQTFESDPFKPDIKYGIKSCEPCQDFIASMLHASTNTPLPVLTCKTKNAGKCVLPPTTLNIGLKTVVDQTNLRCKICWLYYCIKNYNLPVHLRQQLINMLPTDIKVPCRKEVSGKRREGQSTVTTHANTNNRVYNDKRNNIRHMPKRKETTALRGENKSRSIRMKSNVSSSKVAEVKNNNIRRENYGQRKRKNQSPKLVPKRSGKPIINNKLRILIRINQTLKNLNRFHVERLKIFTCFSNKNFIHIRHCLLRCYAHPSPPMFKRPLQNKRTRIRSNTTPNLLIRATIVNKNNQSEQKLKNTKPVEIRVKNVPASTTNVPNGGLLQSQTDSNTAQIQVPKKTEQPKRLHRKYGQTTELKNNNKMKKMHKLYDDDSISSEKRIHNHRVCAKSFTHSKNCTADVIESTDSVVKEAMIDVRSNQTTKADRFKIADDSDAMTDTEPHFDRRVIDNGTKINDREGKRTFGRKKFKLPLKTSVASIGKNELLPGSQVNDDSFITDNKDMVEVPVRRRRRRRTIPQFPVVQRNDYRNRGRRKTATDFLARMKMYATHSLYDYKDDQYETNYQYKQLDEKHDGIIAKKISPGARNCGICHADGGQLISKHSVRTCRPCYSFIQRISLLTPEYYPDEGYFPCNLYHGELGKCGVEVPLKFTIMNGGCLTKHRCKACWIATLISKCKMPFDSKQRLARLIPRQMRESSLKNVPEEELEEPLNNIVTAIENMNRSSLSSNHKKVFVVLKHSSPWASEIISRIAARKGIHL